MVRVVKPNASRAMLAFDRSVSNRGWIVYPLLMVASVAGGVFISSVILTAVATVFWAVFWFVFFKNTVSIGPIIGYIEARYKAWPRIEGTGAETVAFPLLQKIYEHSLDNHPGKDTFEDCIPCLSRLDLLNELAYSHHRDQSDIEDMKAFLSIRKELSG